MPLDADGIIGRTLDGLARCVAARLHVGEGRARDIAEPGQQRVEGDARVAAALDESGAGGCQQGGVLDAADREALGELSQGKVERRLIEPLALCEEGAVGCRGHLNVRLAGSRGLDQRGDRSLEGFPGHGSSSTKGAPGGAGSLPSCLPACQL